MSLVDRIVTICLYILLFVLIWSSTSLALELMVEGVRENDNVKQTWACIALTMDITLLSMRFKDLLDWLFSKIFD